MDSKDLIHAMNNIDDKYISEFADTSKFKKKTKFYLMPRFYGSIAALFVIGISIFIFMPKNNSPTDIIQNNTSTESETYHDDFFGITNNQQKTPQPTYENDVNTANEPADNAVKGENFADDNIFSIKVCSAEISTELNLNDTVQIKGDYNPVMSSSRGIGIEFEITPIANGLTLQTDNGNFVTWNKDTGEITNHSSEYFIEEKSNVFWTTLSPENAVIKILSRNNVISVINISYDENTNTFSAQRIQ